MPEAQDLQAQIAALETFIDSLEDDHLPANHPGSKASFEKRLRELEAKCNASSAA